MSPEKQSPFYKDLSELETQGLLRHLPKSYELPGPTVFVRGRWLVCLASNNYLGISTHPRVIKATCDAAVGSGCGSTGSRLLSGNLSIHESLENEIAAFKGTEAALLFNSGYVANMAILTAMAGEEDLIVSDKLNHASIIDGARASGAKVRWFTHKSVEDAENILSSSIGVRRRFIVTDGVFSMDGDVAPLPELLELARKYEAVLVLDDSHATGVLGKSGRGSFEYFGIVPDAKQLGIPGLVQMGTFSKAFGSFGAFVACDVMTKNFLINKARPFVFTTSLPPPVIAASRESLRMLIEEPAMVLKLADNVNFLKESLKSASFNLPSTPPTPIIPIVVGDAGAAVKVAEALEEMGVYALPVRPPAVPTGTARIRVTVMATHERQHLEIAAKAFKSSFGEARCVQR
ncbi:MAG: 8-amino-7-oxononanoate synthase [Bdellovibrionota bacterium]